MFLSLEFLLSLNVFAVFESNVKLLIFCPYYVQIFALKWCSRTRLIYDLPWKFHVNLKNKAETPFFRDAVRIRVYYQGVLFFQNIILIHATYRNTYHCVYAHK